MIISAFLHNLPYKKIVCGVTYATFTNSLDPATWDDDHHHEFDDGQLLETAMSNDANNGHTLQIQSELQQTETINQEILTQLNNQTKDEKQSNAICGLVAFNELNLAIHKIGLIGLEVKLWHTFTFSLC